MQQNDFLIEILTEELPPKSLKIFSEKLLEEIRTRLVKAELTFAEIKNFATPRRLAVLVSQLTYQQPDKTIERKGPALDRAYDTNGNPTQALLGFAKSAGVEISDLIKLPGNFIGCKQHIKGKTVFEIMPQIVAESLAALPIPKPMRWGNHPDKFIRPVHAVVLLYGDKIIDAEILGIKTGNKTRGHRFLAPEWIEIKNPKTYEEQLVKAFVIASFGERRAIIEKQANNLAQSLGGQIVMPLDGSLIDEITSIVEWPEAFSGSFDKKFLNVPKEALISAMQDHQRYFPVAKMDVLLPNFIAISNMPIKEGQNIIAGNERVLRARLSDAEFFFETDKKIKLADRVEKLKQIVFHNKLGTLHDKTLRLQKLTSFIAPKIKADTTHAERAALLAKTDLTTELVGEFPELQGIAGSYYAQHDKEDDSVRIALREQYFPRFSGDIIPLSPVGTALSLADRIDTLVGIFGINQAPTGDKDPFGLRRAALGILRILIDKSSEMDLRELIAFSAGSYPTLENKNVVDDALNFVLDRLKPWYQEQGIATNIIASVMSLGISKPYDIHRRIQAVMNFKTLPEAESLSVANKRVSNILEKYTETLSAKEIKESLFESDAERNLAVKLVEQEKIIAKEDNYQKILAELANLRAPVDDFFDHVMVMTDDKPKRENRILMLKKLRELFLHVADIALLQ